VSVFKRVVVGEGWGNFVGTLLILGFGVFLVVAEAPRLRGVLQAEPRAMACEAWLAGPREVRWVTLKGCALDGDVLRGPGAPVRVAGTVAPGADVTGYVDAGVLRVGGQPDRARVLGFTAAGFLVLLFGLWPIARRVLLERALPSAPPPDL
jgi:hypothetical protein